MCEHCDNVTELMRQRDEYRSKMFAILRERDQLRDCMFLLRDSLGPLMANIEDDCDHSTGICFCSAKEAFADVLKWCEWYAIPAANPHPDYGFRQPFPPVRCWDWQEPS